MNEIAFECMRCGTCCRNLLEDNKGIRKGLLLTAKEVSLFPSEMISPQLAIGMKKPEKIIIYQLNVNDCPHINDKNECLVYDKRPLICKAFPYVLRGISTKCKVFSYRKAGQFYHDVFLMDELKEASERFDRYIMNHFRKYFKKGIKVWEYDLATKQWIFKAQHNKIPKLSYLS